MIVTTLVQVQFDEDENKEGCGRHWFDFATVYSTPDGAGWYCMPEVGDEVRVVFPDNYEEHAYVASSVHVGAATGGRILMKNSGATGTIKKSGSRRIR